MVFPREQQGCHLFKLLKTIFANDPNIHIIDSDLGENAVLKWQSGVFSLWISQGTVTVAFLILYKSALNVFKIAFWYTLKLSMYFLNS